MGGLNATIFAYGATGAGKTYTIQGNGESPGILMQSVNDLMEAFESDSIFKASIKLSYIEVYNEVLRDLLVTEDKHINIREDPEKGVVVSGASIFNTTSKKDIKTLIGIGDKNRTKESTEANEFSSRSHSVILM